ncbi:hypothetical protein ACM16X_01340 [Haloarcula japonica]|uniref:hypothetical protein n=1 Tax=Haloarcula japonica TaxID=29282 RepID=UPI0039F6F2DE
MGVVGYVGFLGVSVAVAVGVKWFDPAIAAQLSRRTGLTGARGWAILLVALVWVFLPVLAGAPVADGRPWVIGAAISGVGFYLGTIALTSLDEYRILAAATAVPPADLSAHTGGSVVATSGVPTVADSDAAVTPISGEPSVHTDWIAQQRTRVGFRKVWSNVATGVESIPFTLSDGAVAVDSGRHRVFSNAERYTTVAEDESLPDAVAEFMWSSPDLPDPEARDARTRFIEEFVPSSEPVTVVGEPTQGTRPGQVHIESVPPDRLFGTHTDHSESDRDDTEPILIRGTVGEARWLLQKRLFVVGGFGLVMVLGGQMLAFWLSPASLPL